MSAKILVCNMRYCADPFNIDAQKLENESAPSWLPVQYARQQGQGQAEELHKWWQYDKIKNTDMT